jgi:S1-C subfamily serine protease
LAVTNYHVLNQDNPGTLAMFGMACDGHPRPVLDVLYANKLADVALIRLGGDAPFHPVPIAGTSPTPLDPVTVLSHPKHNYFVLTTGVVNRHVSFRGRTGFEEFWMEVTAEYAAGSSGSGVFDARGELIGLVSSNAPLPRLVSDRLPRTPRGSDGNPSKETYYEMTLRRCVPVEAIRACFAERR